MSAFVVDSSIALRWFLEDEEDRDYSLAILKSISEANRPVVPWLWFYEMSNALTVAMRRKRIAFEQGECRLLHFAFPLALSPFVLV